MKRNKNDLGCSACGCYYADTYRKAGQTCGDFSGASAIPCAGIIRRLTDMQMLALQRMQYARDIELRVYQDDAPRLSPAKVGRRAELGADCFFERRLRQLGLGTQ